MSKRKKGISADEKRSLLLEIFHEKKEFYQLKDVEKIAVKDKGMKEQVVKDILQSLVDEGLVESDKIGSSVYFWSFPYKKRKLMQNEVEQLQQKVIASNCKLEELNKKVENAKLETAESSKRADVFEKFKKLKSRDAKLQADIKHLKDNDKNVLLKIQKSLPKVHDAANRWTDNIFSVRSWCRNRFNIDENLIDKQFQIPSDLDYLE